jgi:pyridoxamine 5'-phosphate oxidase
VTPPAGGLGPAGLVPDGMIPNGMAADPMEQFGRWYGEAQAAGEREPEAMALATASGDGAPSVRFVLLKGFDRTGFVFYTNRTSRKGSEMAANHAVALAWRWASIDRQVRVTGLVVAADDASSDAYFATRARGSQLGAWASKQSQVVADRAELERSVAAADERFAHAAVPRPPWWGGYLVRPETVEFWQGRPDRLHDRLVYRRDGDSGWRLERLSP